MINSSLSGMAGKVSPGGAVGKVVSGLTPTSGGTVATLRPRVTIQLVPDAQKVTTIVRVLEAGHADRLLISSDFSSPRGLKKNGGGGLGQAVTVFAPLLRDAGVGDKVLRQIFEENPKRFLAFVPR